MAIGGALGAFLARRTRHAPLTGCICAVVASLPDSVDWLLHAVLGTPRWDTVYNLWHHGWLAWASIALPPAGLHVLMDIPLHAAPGQNWWPAWWWAEVLTWLAAIALTYLTWRAYAQDSHRGSPQPDG